MEYYCFFIATAELDTEFNTAQKPFNELESIQRCVYTTNIKIYKKEMAYSISVWDNRIRPFRRN